MSVILDYFQQKLMKKKIIKRQKNLQIGFILGPFYPF